MAKTVQPEPAEAIIEQASQDVTALLAQAPSVKVTCTADAEIASAELQGIAKVRKEIAGRRDLIIKPLKDHVRYLEGEFRKVEAPLIEREGVIRGAMSEFARAEAARAREQEAKLQAQHQAKVEKAAAKGKIVTAPAPVVERPQSTFATAQGSTSMRKVKKVRITSVVEFVSQAQVKKLLIEEAQRTGLLDKLAKKLVDAGVTLKGVEVYDDFVPVNRV